MSLEKSGLTITFYSRFVKNGIDRIVSGIMLIVLSPLFLLISIWVKLDSKGPVFFRQIRIGKNSEPFTIYKFRTMRIDAPNIATSEFENPEDFITKSGKILRKTSLDELPQLLNVFKGEMSFIGPRPLIPSEKMVLNLRTKNGSDKILPGITGLAQVRGRDEVSNSEKALIDGLYSKKISFKVDTKILLKTVFDVTQGRGIHEGKKGDSSK